MVVSFATDRYGIRMVDRVPSSRALSDLVSDAADASDPTRARRHVAGDEARRAWWLAWLSAASELRDELDEQMANAARDAALAGASYGDLGSALGTSRQAARKRWPDLPVPARRLLTAFDRARSAQRSPRHTSREGRQMLPYVDIRSLAVGVDAPDWRAAVEASGRLLLDAEWVEERYVAAMLRTVEELGPYVVIAPGVAIPHARPEDGARQVGLSLAALSEPVEFGSAENDPVDLVFAFATSDPNGHLELMQALADFIEEGENLEALRRAGTAGELLRIMQHGPGERSHDNA